MRLIDADAFYENMRKTDISFMQQIDIMTYIKSGLDKQPTIHLKMTNTRQYLVVRPDDTVEVLLLKNKNDTTWSFVNLTKGHICPCKFKSIKEALADMDRLVKEGKIIRYQRID